MAIGEYFIWSRDMGWEGGRVQPIWAELPAMPLAPLCRPLADSKRRALIILGTAGMGEARCEARNLVKICPVESLRAPL